MDYFYFIASAIAGFATYDIGKYFFNKLRRRWGDNPSDATYGGKR